MGDIVTHPDLMAVASRLQSSKKFHDGAICFRPSNRHCICLAKVSQSVITEDGVRVRFVDWQEWEWRFICGKPTKFVQVTNHLSKIVLLFYFQSTLKYLQEKIDRIVSRDVTGQAQERLLSVLN
ncbi:hypothetical protein DEMA109039_15335 [Deinococcus marmoris]